RQPLGQAPWLGQRSCHPDRLFDAPGAHEIARILAIGGRDQTVRFGALTAAVEVLLQPWAKLPVPDLALGVVEVPARHDGVGERLGLMDADARVRGFQAASRLLERCWASRGS